MEGSQRCAICKQDGEGPYSTLREKGCSTINQASIARKDNIHTVPGERVHKECRRIYCNPHQIAKDSRKEESNVSTTSDTHVLRSSEEQFAYKTHCLFCGRPAKFGRKRKMQDVLNVRTIEFKDTLLAICRE